MSDIVADVPNILNTRAAVVLTGYGAAGPCNVAEAIISLLRSDEPIDRDVRELLADALARGHFGNRIDETNEDGLAVPRLEITGLGRDGRVGKAILERHKWLDAAEALVGLRASGTKGRAAIEAIGSEFGLGFEVVEKAVKLHNRFNKELDDPASELVKSALNFWRDNQFSRSNTEHYYFARSLFVEREADKAVK